MRAALISLLLRVVPSIERERNLQGWPRILVHPRQEPDQGGAFGWGVRRAWSMLRELVLISRLWLSSLLGEPVCALARLA